MIILKTENEITKMRRAGEKLARLLDDLLKSVIVPGASAYDVEQFSVSYMKEIGAKPILIGYNGYPYATCVSVNDEVIHGYPLKSKVFKDGDLVSVDLDIEYDGMITDAARTYAVGTITDKEKELIQVTEKSFFIGLEQAVIGKKTGDIGYAVQSYAESFGFGVVRDFVGHGVGRKVHEDPSIPNYGYKGTGPMLRKNMTITIEPMISLGNYEVEILQDGWTVVTIDKSKSAHYENTIVITDNGPEVLTAVTGYNP